MKKVLLFAVLAAAAGLAQAQIKCWTDANGKRACGDTPPPGARISTVRVDSGGTPPPPPPAATKDAKKGPLTPAEQDQEFRKRRQEAEKAQAKADAERQDKAARNEGCERTKEYLRTLESGQRIARTNPAGERYYLDEAATQREIEKARESMAKACSGN